MRPFLWFTILLAVLFFPGSPLWAMELFDFNYPRFFRAEPEERIKAENLETFLDAFFAREMKRLNIPGAVFSMVENGELVFARGYGYANLPDKVPVCPETTIFRVASVSKVFTATAAMQLYEQGLLDLMEDVSVYLGDFPLAKNGDTPLTMHHLLTHTGGFDDRSVNLAFERKDRIPSLEDYLAANIPPRVRPPGEVISYSNHGLALAGLVVEKISGRPFVDYARLNLLEPLGMERSSFLLPPELAPHLATGYFPAGGINRPRGFDYLYNIAPAASLNATANDMALFMIAHLQGGRLQRERIVQEETAVKMQSQQFVHPRQEDGVCYGFFEDIINNRRFIHHSGLWGGFASRLFLYPEGNLGFFVSLNSNAGAEVHRKLTAEFVNAFLPPAEEGPEEKEPAGALLESFKSQVSACAGSYRPVRHSRHSLEKIKVLTARCRVKDLGQGGMALELATPSGWETVHWAEAEPFFFRQQEGEETLSFRHDDRGRVTHLFWGTVAMERLAWYENTSLHRAAAVAFLIVFLSAWAGWPLLRLYRGRKAKDGGRWREHWPAGTAALLNTIFLTGFIYFITVRADELVYGVPFAVTALLTLPLLAAALTAWSVWTAVRSWKNHHRSLAGRLHYSLVVLFLLLFIPFLHYWNLLGFRY